MSGDAYDAMLASVKHLDTAQTGQRGAGGRTPDAVDSLSPACSRPSCSGGTLHALHLAVDARCAQSRRDAEAAAAVCATIGHKPGEWDRWRSGRARCMRCGGVA